MESTEGGLKGGRIVQYAREHKRKEPMDSVRFTRGYLPVNLTECQARGAERGRHKSLRLSPLERVL